jgi:starch synthase
VHCHDWLTALIIMWMRKAGYPYSSVFTIHNLAYQGFFDEEFLHGHDVLRDWDYFPPDAPKMPLSFMSQAVLWADLVTTVSETYAREITTPQMGVGLDNLLRYRGDSLTGIVNGLDYEEWDPMTDKVLPVNFGPDTLHKRKLNKVALQRVAGLPVDSDIPLIGMVQRLDEQKGIDIVNQAIEPFIRETGAQLVILGRGWDNYEALLRQLSARFPQNVSAFIAFEESLAHLIYSGSDIFLMPSRFEPCGLGQIIAMRYGALPVVRHTGGLVDTVPEFTAGLKEGNGFVFHDYTAEALTVALKKAVESFKDRKTWLEAVQRVMNVDYSWEVSARQYEAAYRRVIKKGK